MLLPLPESTPFQKASPSLHDNNNHQPLEQEYQENNFDNDNPHELDKLLIKIYEDNIDKITTSSKLMQITTFISFISFILFLTLLTLTLHLLKNISYFITFIPLLLSLITLLISFNMFIYIKDIFDNDNNNTNKTVTPVKKGNVFSFILLNACGCLLALFILLIAFYIDNIKHNSNDTVDLNIMFIPFYIAMILALIYVIFISPAFVSNGMYIETFLMFSYAIGAFVFGFLLCMTITSSDSAWKYVYAFVPFYFVIGATVVFNVITTIINRSKVELTFGIVNCVGLLFVLIAGVVLQLKLDKVINNSKHYIEMVLLLFGVVMLCGKNVLTFCVEYCCCGNNKDEDGIDNLQYIDN